MATRKLSGEPLSIDRAAELAAERVRATGGWPISKLGVPKAIRPAVLDRLRDQGFEITKSNVRQPVTAQLRAALSSGAFLALKSLKAYVVAATVGEAKAAALDLVRAGQAHLVLRAGAPTLVPADAEVLGEHDLGVLAQGLDATLKQVRKAAKAKAKLLRQDVTRLLEPLLRAHASESRGPEAAEGTARAVSAGVAPKPSRAPLVERVSAAVEAAIDPRTGLAFVPAVVRSLSSEAGVAAALDAVREAAQGGLIELRPESGLGRLTSEEQALCVPGPEGSRLSWARSRREAGR